MKIPEPAIFPRTLRGYRSLDGEWMNLLNWTMQEVDPELTGLDECLPDARHDFSSESTTGGTLKIRVLD